MVNYARILVCVAPYSRDHGSVQKMPFVERVHCAREREARLYQRRLRDRERPRERLATETAEEREARLARRRVQAKSRLAAESGETQLEHLRSYREKANCCTVQRREKGLPIRFALRYLTEAVYNLYIAIFVVLRFKL